MAHIPFFWVFILSKFVLWAWEEYLRHRQRAKKQQKAIPLALTGKISGEEYRKSQSYTLDKLHFQTIKEFIMLSLELVFFLSGAFPLLWDKVEIAVEWIHFNSKSDVAKGSIFTVGSLLVMNLLSTPFDAYFAFVIDEKYGFNKQTAKLFIKDKLLGLVIGVVLSVPIVAGLITLINVGGPLFWLYAWLFTCVVLVVVILLYPNVIAPLFNKFTELEPGDLREKIESMAKRVEFPLQKIYIMDASKRTGHSNAYFFGFGKNKRIVLFDTLLGIPHDQITGILCHELGHWRYMHIFKGFIITSVHLLVMFVLFGYFKDNPVLFQNFGFSESSSTFIGLSLFMLLYTPVELVLGFLVNKLSRYFEGQADAYAAGLGYSEELKEALVQLFVKNMADVDPDWLYSTYHYSHPTLMERIKELSEHNKTKSE